MLKNGKKQLLACILAFSHFLSQPLHAENEPELIKYDSLRDDSTKNSWNVVSEYEENKKKTKKGNSDNVKEIVMGGLSACGLAAFYCMLNSLCDRCLKIEHKNEFKIENINNNSLIEKQGELSKEDLNYLYSLKPESKKIAMKNVVDKDVAKEISKKMEMKDKRIKIIIKNFMDIYPILKKLKSFWILSECACLNEAKELDLESKIELPKNGTGIILTANSRNDNNYPVKVNVRMILPGGNKFLDLYDAIMSLDAFQQLGLSKEPTCKFYKKSWYQENFDEMFVWSSFEIKKK